MESLLRKINAIGIQRQATRALVKVIRNHLAAQPAESLVKLLPDQTPGPKSRLIRRLMSKTFPGAPVRLGVPKSVRNAVWNRWNDPTQAVVICPVCETNFMDRNGSGWDISHVVSVHLGGTNDPSNLRTICSCCNRSMGSHGMVDWIEMNYGSRAGEIKARLGLASPPRTGRRRSCCRWF